MAHMATTSRARQHVAPAPTSSSGADRAVEKLSGELTWRNRFLWLAGALGLATVVGLGWRASESRVGIADLAPLLGLAATGASLGLAWLRHQDATQLAEDLILIDHPVDERSAAGRAIAKRIRSLERDRSRAHLAEELRWQLSLAEEAAEAEAAGTRARTISTLNADQRRALLASRERVGEMAAMAESGEVDPRALILLARVSNPSPVSAARDPDSGATLARRLDQAWTVIGPL